MELITSRQVRKILGISRNKLRFFYQSNMLTCYEIKGVRGFRFDLEQVKALVKESDACPRRA